MTPHPVTHRDLARLHDARLRDTSSRIDLRNRGAARSTYRLDELFFALVRLIEPSLFVEAGAFEAQASRRVREEVRNCRAVAFEANPHTHAYFDSTIDFEAAGVEYLNLALSDTEGEATFHVQVPDGAWIRSRVDGSNSVTERRLDIHSKPFTGATEDVTVPATTIDLHLGGGSGHVAMWIDVEGASGPVLQGAAKTLARTSVLKIEVEELEWWTGQWLALDVFEFLLSSGLVPVARDLQGPHQYNVVCVRNDIGWRADVLARIDEFTRASAARELPGLVGSVRRNPQARAAARLARERLRPTQ